MEEQSEQQSRRNLVQLVAIIVVVSLLGIGLGLLIDWFPTQASVEGEKIDTLYDVLMVCSVPMFVLVATVVVYSVIRFRMRPGQELMDGPPIHGNTRLEVFWTALPAIMLVSLCSYAYATLHTIEKDQPGQMKIQVTGEQFAWSYVYPEAPGGKPVASDQLYVPVGRQIEFDVKADDVIHDFWVPAFRMKIDAVPGITTNVKMTPDKLGQYPVVCAELCGYGHALMRSTVHVVSQSQFDAWLAKQSGSSS